MFDTNSNPSSGYISGLTRYTAVTVNWTHTAPSVGDYVQIHIPLRTGDLIRVVNPQEQILGNHIITGLNLKSVWELYKQR